MIEIKYICDKNELNMSIEGNADYAPEGQDIICASVSILLHALIGRLKETGAGLTATMDKGEAWLHAEGEDIEEIFKTVLSGYLYLAVNCPEYVSLRGDLYPE